MPEEFVNGIRASRSPSVSSCSSFTSGWSLGRSASVTEDDESSLSNSALALSSITPESSVHSFKHRRSGASPSPKPSLYSRVQQPVAPLSSGATLIWANTQALAITNNRPLHDIVEPHSLALLQDWAEAVDTNCDGPHSPRSCPNFSLEIGHPPRLLDLIKTFQPVGPDDEFALVVLTATRNEAAPMRVDENGVKFPAGLHNSEEIKLPKPLAPQT